MVPTNPISAADAGTRPTGQFVRVGAAVPRVRMGEVGTNVAVIADLVRREVVLGAPLRIRGKVANAAVGVADGRAVVATAKTFLPTYGEFYEGRWFASADEIDATSADDVDVLGHGMSELAGREPQDHRAMCGDGDGDRSVGGREVSPVRGITHCPRPRCGSNLLD